MKIKAIVTLMCVVAVLAFALPILLGMYMGSSSEPESTVASEIHSESHYLSAVLYILFISVCFFLLPLLAWLKGKRRVLAVILALIGIFFGWLIFSYLRNPDTTEDHGMVVFGFIFYVPPFTFFVQLLIYGLTKILSHIRVKRE